MRPLSLASDVAADPRILKPEEPKRRGTVHRREFMADTNRSGTPSPTKMLEIRNSRTSSPYARHWRHASTSRRMVGRVVPPYLDDSRLRENTVIVLWGDTTVGHLGEPLGRVG